MHLSQAARFYVATGLNTIAEFDRNSVGRYNARPFQFLTFKRRLSMKAKNQSEHTHWLIFISIIGAITFAGYFVLSPKTLFKSGDDIGYNIGLIGGIMMLILLLYPLRKRAGFMQNLGFLPTWFRWHMVLGILGPLMIIFHSTYHIGSINAGVALVCMLLVSSSGTFGRFFYTKIHHGLYGRQTTLNEIRAEMETTEEVKSVFHFAPTVEMALDQFHDRGIKYSKESGYGFVHFIKIGFEASSLTHSLSKEIHQIMHKQARDNNFNAQQMAGMEKMYQEYREKLIAYIRAVRDTAQFHTYERLFSWWHIFHIPLVYMMVFSAFYHVYAVHAY